LQCTYCYLSSKGRNTLAASDALAVVSDVLSRENREVCIHFTGGEPLLCWDLLLSLTEGIRELTLRQRGRNSQGVYFSLQTNGLLLDADKLRTLKSENIRLCLSLDGDAPVHDLHRIGSKGEGSHGSLNLSLIPPAERTEIPVTVVVTPKTATHLTESIAWLSRAGFKWVIPKFDILASWDEPTMAQAASALDEFQDWYAGTAAGSETLIVAPILDLARSIYYKWSDLGCAEGKSAIAVAPTGEVFPCSLRWALSRRGATMKNDVDAGIGDCAHCDVARCGLNCGAYSTLALDGQRFICWYSRHMHKVASAVLETVLENPKCAFVDALESISTEHSRCYWA
jgi:uncharacterized protein